MTTLGSCGHSSGQLNSGWGLTLGVELGWGDGAQVWPALEAWGSHYWTWGWR